MVVVCLIKIDNVFVGEELDQFFIIVGVDGAVEQVEEDSEAVKVLLFVGSCCKESCGVGLWIVSLTGSLDSSENRLRRYGSRKKSMA
jgi:hypothetical protein